MQLLITAIIDTAAQDLVGACYIHKHRTAAIRMFQDIYNAEQKNQVNQHPADFVLVILATLDPENSWETTPAYEVLVTGAQIAALKPER